MRPNACLGSTSDPVVEYPVEFSTLAAESGWDEVALQTVFRRGLSGQVHNALVTGARPANLDELIDYQREWHRERAFVSSPPPSTTCHRFPPPSVVQSVGGDVPWGLACTAARRAVTSAVPPCSQKIELISACRGVGEHNFFLLIVIACGSPRYPVVGAGGNPGFVSD